MANGAIASGTTATAPATRGTGRENFLAPLTPVDEKRFESEIRRMDATISEEKKNREKFETRIEKAVNDLRGEVNTRFDNMEKSVDTRFDKLEKSVDVRFDKLEKSVDTRFDKVDMRFDKLEESVDTRFDKLEKSADTRFDKIDARMNHLDNRLWWIFGAVALSILVPIVMKYL
jgi:ribosome-associated translation inhibitor RaiA